MPEQKIVGPVKYAALGDSTGVGVGAREGGYVARIFNQILTAKPGSTLTNHCISGATTETVLREELEPAISAGPNLVTLGIGINDIGHGIAREDFAGNFEQILSRLQSETKAIIIVANIPDVSSAPRIPAPLRGEYHQRIVEFNRELESIAARHGVTVFDVYSVTHEELPKHPEFFSGDGFHPSDEGYEIWAARMWPTVARVI